MSDSPRITDRQMDAMQAIFDLCKEIEGGLTINDLVRVMEMAVTPESRQGLAIALGMASLAASRVAGPVTEKPK